MPASFTQLYLHYVFATRNRERLIEEAWRPRLEGYLRGIAENQGHHVHAIYAMPEHVHMLVGLHPSVAPADLARSLKANSSKWINEEGLTPEKFHWQQAYGVFSHSPENLHRVVRYIQNQPEHHARQDYRTELTAILHRYNIAFDERYLFRE